MEACQISEALVVLVQVGCIVGIIREPNHDEGVSGREGGMPGGGMPAFRGAGGAPPGGLHCWHHL